jgi:hypothetical protein
MLAENRRLHRQLFEGASAEWVINRDGSFTRTLSLPFSGEQLEQLCVFMAARRWRVMTSRRAGIESRSAYWTAGIYRKDMALVDPREPEFIWLNTLIYNAI